MQASKTFQKYSNNNLRETVLVEKAKLATDNSSWVGLEVPKYGQHHDVVMFLSTAKYLSVIEIKKSGFLCCSQWEMSYVPFREDHLDGMEGLVLDKLPCPCERGR